MTSLKTFKISLLARLLRKNYLERNDQISCDDFLFF